MAAEEDESFDSTDEEENHKELARAREWLEEKWMPTGEACQVCGENDWQVRILTKLDPLRPPYPGATYPVFPIVCDNCGNVMFLDAFITGAVKGKTPEEHKAETESESEE